MDSVYTRVTGISGTPLRDGYDFGQTIVNDYGRPYWTGFNNVTGVTADAEAGPSGIFFSGRIPTRAGNAFRSSTGVGGDSRSQSHPTAAEWNAHGQSVSAIEQRSFAQHK